MKKIISLILICCLTLNIVPVFAYSESVETEGQILSVLSSLNIMNGDENGDFVLDNLVARSEFTKMAVASSKYRNSVSSVSRTSPFHDVPYTYWGASYIKAALGAGFVSGYPDSTFRPEDPVTLEEGVTIVLKLLGYTDDDFKNTIWPFGEMTVATDLELLNNVDKIMGQNLQRRDVMHLIYNALSTNLKDSNETLLSSFGYIYEDDCIFIASSSDDASIANNRILTSKGQFKITDSFDTSFSGYKGGLVLKNSDTAVAFVPENIKSGEYTLNAIVGDDVLVYSGNGTKTISVGKNTEVYYKSDKVTLETASGMAMLGDSVSIFTNNKGDVDYAVIGSKALKGPYTVLQDLSYYGISDSASCYIDGEKSDLSKVNAFDVIYYSEEVNTVWAYTKKVTGVYMGASPSKDNPQTVNISGIDYGFETADAYKLFATGGTYNIGDSVTILLGRNGKIAGVKTSDTKSGATVIGYLTDAGSKTFEKANKETYTSYYVNIVLADGTKQELITSRNYKEIKSSIVKATVKDGVATVNKLSSTPLTGTVDAKNNKIGTKKIASNCNFIEILNTNPSEPSIYSVTYKTRLDKTTLTGRSVLYYTTNSEGEVDSVFLNDVTGDGYEYGIVTKADNRNYTILTKNGTYTSSGVQYTSIETGSVVKVLVWENKVYAITKLTEVDERITEINDYSIVTNEKTYPIYENVASFKRTDVGQWQVIPYSDITSNDVSVYTDNKALSKIRVIIK